MIEIWKDIKGYEGLYQVSNMGRVKSLEKKLRGKNNGVRTLAEKCLKLKTHLGYHTVNLYKDGKQKTFFVHILVADNFIPNPENKPCIDHINTIRSDNRVENLRWCTHKENSNNPLTLKHNSDGQKDKNTIIQLTIDRYYIRTWNCANDIERELGIKSSRIIGCCKGKKKHNTVGGYRWMYKN